MLRRRLLVAALLVAGGLGATAAPRAGAAPAAPAGPAIAAPHSIGIRLLDEPTALKNDPRAAAYVIDQLRPGTTITRKFEVSNNTGHATVVSLNPSAATIGSQGFGIDAGQAPDELTGWTTLSAATVPLAEGASAIESVTIAVPAHATSGERYEGLVAALPLATSPTGLSVENRVAIRVYLSVSSSRMPVPAPDFTISTLQARRLPDGTPQITATIRNTGGRALDLTGTLQLTDGPGGIAAGPYDTDGASTLAVGAGGEVTVALSPKIPAGPWDARIDLRSGLLHRAATGSVTFPAAGAGPAVPAHAVPLARNRHVLIPLVAGLLGLVIVGLLLVAWRRRRDDDGDEDEDETGGSPTEGPAEPEPTVELDSLLRR